VELRDDARGGELQAVLHQAINDLPRGARLAIVLCDLEGRSPRSTAKQLGWPLLRVEMRLVQARRRLQARLAERGVFLSVSQGIGEWLDVGESAVPRRLIESTVQVVTRRWRRRAARAIRIAARRSVRVE
jgi:hypothetical protein